MKRLAYLCALLGVTVCLSFAQNPRTPRSSVTKPASEPAVEDHPANADDMREHQLRVFRDHILARALDNIRKMDEAGLRVSARNQLLSYLVTDKQLSDENEVLATQIAREALTDLREHNDEIIPFMLSYLSNDLGSWIQKHRSSLKEEFEKTIDAKVNGDASQRISALFNLDGGETLAAKQIREELEAQGALNGLNFWLDELMKRNSKEFEPLAADIVTKADLGQISFETLFWISDVYLRSQTSNALRNRFLTTVVARTQPANFVTEPPPQVAYDLLNKLLPVIKHSVPSLYDHALNQSFVLRASLSERQLARETRLKRLRESTNPIADLKSEADSAKTRAERNELLLEAAQLALDQKKLDVSLDIVSEMDVNIAATDAALWRRSVDQLLKNVVRAALTGKLPAVAEKGAARIGSALTRVEALNLIMRHHVKADDKEAAQRVLAQAAKVAESAPDTSEKAKAFFLLSVATDQVDESKRADLTLSGIKTLNNLTPPDRSARDKSIHKAYVQRLDNSGYELTKAFKGLAKQDENAALALVEKLEKTDLRTFALIGILLGVDGLLTNSN